MAVDIPKVLERLQSGSSVAKKDLEVVAKAASNLGQEFLRDATEGAIDIRRGAPDYEAFTNCVKSMGDLLLKYGFISADELHSLWYQIENPLT